MTKTYKTAIFALTCTLLISIAISLKLGQLDISFQEIYNTFLFHEDELITDIIFNLRLPRIIFAALVGCGLALCGYVMQASVQNPLADPYILGISSGASLGATFFLLVNFTIGSLGQEILISISAFLGAVLAIGLVYITATYKGKLTTTHLVLAGVIVNTLCTATSNMLIYTAKDIEGIRSVTFWTMGSLANISWFQVSGVAFVLLLCIIYFLTQLRTLNIISLGDDTAITLGVNTHLKRKIYILIVTLLTGIMVAQCGIIGFIGLIIPHAIRAICHTSNSNILPVVLLSGSVFLVLIDLLSRVALSNQEIPIGIITSVIGAPIFLIIFLKKDYGA